MQGQGGKEDRMEGPTDGGNSQRRRDSEGNRLPDGGGVSIMPGTGQKISNLQGIAAAIKVYDGGVESCDLTLSEDHDWQGTIDNCEDTVATLDFKFGVRSRRTYLWCTSDTSWGT